MFALHRKNDIRPPKVFLAEPTIRFGPHSSGPDFQSRIFAVEMFGRHAALPIHGAYEQDSEAAIHAWSLSYLKGGGGLTPRHTRNPSGHVRKHRRTIRNELLPRLCASRPTQIKLTTTTAASSAIAMMGSGAFIQVSRLG
jgi:hypothetical protein